jgi:hypothetical protein
MGKGAARENQKVSPVARSKHSAIIWGRRAISASTYARVLFIAWSLALALAACSDGGSTESGAGSPSDPLALTSFSGPACDAYEAYITDSFTEQFLTPIRCLAIGPCPLFLGLPETSGAVSAGGDTGIASAPERVSQTNTQEEGVDEADIVKSDSLGNLYVLTGRRLVILDAFPPAGLDQRPQAVLDLGAGDNNFYASDFFLDEPNRRLVALGSTFDTASGSTVSVIVDVSDPAAPLETMRLSVDGFPLTSRRIGARVHRVARYDIPLPASIYDDSDLQGLREDYFRALADGREADAAEIKEKIRSRIGDIVHLSGATAYLPRVRTKDTESPLACSDIAHPQVQTGMGLVVLESFDTDGSRHAADAVVNNAHLVYASASNFFLAQNSIGWFFVPDQPDETAIYRFSLSADGPPVYQGFGRAPGSVINPYSLSEQAGHLRVASTETRFTGSGVQTENHLTVLRSTGTQMPVIGDVSGFDPGEMIRGARFAGDRGFVVTFRQVDPLFAFDLSDPAQPRIADELKIPGFSSYLMPLGGDYLLTIGRAGDEQQLNGHVAIQLFDVRDLENIQQVSEIDPAAGDGSYSYSSAEYDPHAFSYFSDAVQSSVPGILSVPLQAFGSTGAFAGFLVVRVDPSAKAPLAELGRIDHRDLVPPDPCSKNPGFYPSCEPSYLAEPRCSVFTQDANGSYLYTISALGVKANSAADPSQELGWTLLPYDPPICCFALPTEPVGGIVSTSATTIR